MSVRTPPQNVDAEKSVLGALLLDNESAHEVVEILRPEDFYKKVHQEIFDCVLSLLSKNEPADLVTVTNEFKNKNELEKIGGATYLAALVEAVPTAANVMHYAKIVQEKAILRGVIDAATQIVQTGYEDNQDVASILDNAEKVIFEVSQKRAKNALVPIGPIIKDSFVQIEKNYEQKSLITGLPTGFKDFDRMTSGLQPSDLVIVAGRPSMGKTSFCMNIVEHVALKEKVPVAVFSLEMSKEQLVIRMMCSGGRIDSTKVKSGMLSEDEWQRLTDIAGPLSMAPVFIDDTPSLSTFEIRAKARRLKSAKGLGLVVVDYLQLMTSRSKVESREREISEISRGLKAMAKELHVPVIALSQLNRGVEGRQDKRPQLADLRESGAIEQDADLVGFIYRDEVYNKDSPDKGIAEFHVVKHRNGPIGMAKMAFLGEFTRFENLAYDDPSH